MSNKLSKIVSEKQLRNSTQQMIISIIKDTPRGSEQRYQKTSNILDILKTTKLEEDIVNKLKNLE